MAKCKCGTKARIVSDIVQSMPSCSCPQDVCVNPIFQDPEMLGIFAPLIYDEIGINLCATFSLGVTLSTTYPTAVSAKAQVISASYTYGTGNVVIETIAGRPNCTDVTLSNLSITFAVSLYDGCCRLLGTVIVDAVYLPPLATASTYDEETNPTSVELEIFTPYGVSYSTGESPTAILNFIGSASGSNYITQGLNLYGMAKVLDLDTDESTVTMGLTLVLQSLYFAGYKVQSKGKIEVPKGCIISPENSDCRRFVAGELLNLEIKPLDLGISFIGNAPGGAPGFSYPGAGCVVGNVPEASPCESGCTINAECAPGTSNGTCGQTPAESGCNFNAGSATGMEFGTIGVGAGCVTGNVPDVSPCQTGCTTNVRGTTDSFTK